MSDPSQPGPPAWLPASVRAAAKWRDATDDDALSGRTWEHLLDALDRAGAIVRSPRTPSSALERAAGYRHLLVLLALGIDEALRPSDPYDPVLRPGNVDAALKWGMDCPDAAYVGCALRGDAVYRITGRRGTVRYLGFQVMAGIESTANVVADDLDISPDGTFELTLSASERPGNWMPLDERASSLVVRQFFYDWDTETPAQLTIECIEAAERSAGTPPLTPGSVGRQLEALGDFVEASLSFWLDLEDAGRAAGVNAFRPPAARTDLGGAAENVTVWGSWDLDEHEALLIEVRPPEALYWSVALGDHWWESLDYANHQSSLNGFQAVLDEDGAFQAVVAGRDPGVANWLDSAGRRQGPMIFRWVRAGDAPVPETRVVELDRLDEVLPPGTVRVDTRARAEVVGRRRAAVRRRFCR